MRSPGALVAGASFGPYDLVAELGRGGMGAVFRARERASGRELAVKVMLDASEATAADRERFRREGQVAAALDHPGIVRVHTAGELGGLMFLACELVEGARDLAAAARALPPLERVRLVRDAARALGHAHARGVVHRDVKPDNLLVDAEGRVRVADFGVAAARSLDRLTQTGAIVGTPRYMAPEQIDGDRQRIGPHSDVWALGVVLHEVLAGARPFDATSLPGLYNLILNKPPPDLRVVAPDAPPGAAEVCARALAKAPDGRYTHAAALADDLDRVLAGEGTVAGTARRSQRRRGGLVVAALLLGGSAAAFALGTRRPAAEDPSVVASVASGSVDRAPPALEVVGEEAHGWVLLASSEGGLEVRGHLGEGTLTVRVDGQVLQTARGLPLVVPVAPGSWSHVEVDLPGTTGIDARVLRLPSHLERVGPSAARTRDAVSEVLLLVPPPSRGTFDRRPLRAGNGSNVAKGYDTLSTEKADLGRQVQLDYPLLLGRCEVSRARFSLGPVDAPDLPIGDVSYADAAAWAASRDLVLPTLTEWMWAAGGGDEGRDWPWGDGVADRPANFDGPGACPVGAMPEGAGRWGHLHLAGNVLEWVEAGEASNSGALGFPQRVSMGGSFKKPWPSSATDLRCRVKAEKYDTDTGFRIAWRPAAR